MASYQVLIYSCVVKNCGVKVCQSSMFRKDLSSLGIEVLFIKNSLFKNACNFFLIEKKLKNENIVFYGIDFTLLSKKVLSLSKTVPISVKFGLLEGTYVKKEKVECIANLPSKKEIYLTILDVISNIYIKIMLLINSPNLKILELIKKKYN